MAELMECRAIEELLAVGSLGGLEPGAGAQVTEHLARCGACRDLARAYVAVVDSLPGALEPVQPPPSLRRNLMSQVYTEASGARAAVRRPTLWRRLWDAVPAGRPFTLGAAAAMAAVVGLAVWGAGRGASPAAPRAEAFRVLGTTAQPAAAGTLAYDPAAGHSVLTVRGLSRPVSTGGGATPVYEVWLIPSQGAPVAAGFLTLQPDGQTWAAVVSGDVHRYSALAATTEPAGGTIAPTGSQVITASLG
jgi:anti-sigma-K factor RskA